jgi:hypothetical protein
VYARTVGGEELTFGVSGMLWHDNLVMYDRQTDSWWGQADGRAIHGPKRGAFLDQVASHMMTWKQWRTLYPRTRVLFTGASGAVRDTYASYHRSRSFGVTGRTRSSGALDPKRLVGFRLNRGAFAVPLDTVTKAGVLQVSADGRSIVLVAPPDGTGARSFIAGNYRFLRAGERATAACCCATRAPVPSGMDLKGVPCRDRSRASASSPLRHMSRTGFRGSRFFRTALFSDSTARDSENPHGATMHNVFVGRPAYVYATVQCRFTSRVHDSGTATGLKQILSSHA